MKINEPVTDREVPFPEGSILVSRTDRKGIITYANPAFVAVSGYPENELLGRNHNVVRHPDMPPEAFQDLWDTVHAGCTWTGIVKNRARGGDYYWVRANVTPVPLADGEVEYLSVRTAATAEEKRAAEHLYAEVRAGRAKVPRSLAVGSPWQLERVIVGASALVAVLASAALLALVAGASHVVLYPLLLLVVIASAGAGIALHRHVLSPLRDATARLREFVSGEYFNWAVVTERGAVGDLQQAIRSTQIKLGFEVTDAQRRANETARVQTALDCASTNVMVADADLNICYLNKAVQNMLQEAELDLREHLPKFDSSKVLGRSIDQFHAHPEHQRALLAGLRKPFASELQVGVRTFRIIANPVLSRSGERLGTVVEWADLTAQRTAERERAEREATERRYAAENLRIRTALDNVSSCVMMSDTDDRVVYMNRASEEMFGGIQDELARVVPGFSAARLLDSDINMLGPRRDGGKGGLLPVDGQVRRELAFGPVTLAFTASPVRDREGRRIGSVVEWVDRTGEIAMDDELEEIVAAARAGELSRRVAMEGKQGFFRHLAVAINALIDDLSGVFSELSESLAAMASGDLGRPVTHDYKGEFGRLKDSLNNTLLHLSRTVTDLNASATAVNTAANEISSGNGNLSARTEQQASSLQETAASMDQLTSTVRNNADNAQQANSVAGSARLLAEKGGEVVGRAVSAMEQINTASTKIAEIIGVIDEIAFQTNLLALNASVEAARAGEQGRGFAVVATEVRNLASRSADAAKQIKTLINDSVLKVKAGTELVNESGTTLGEIVLGVKKVGDIVAEIAAASKEQTVGIDQVSKAIVSIDELTQQNAALAEQTSAASASLYQKAQQVQGMLGFFKVTADLEGLIEAGTRAGGTAAGQPGGADFDFFSARTAHLAWRQRIRDFLDGARSLSHEEAVSHRDCALGKWLYADGLERYGHISEMQLMEKEHERLHALIREIVELKHGGDDASAEQRFGDIEALSAEIVALLKSVERSVAH
jgi:methyl-accepting chemotaxis protein